MRVAVCLHGAAVARAALPLHPTDRGAIALALSLAAEVLVAEAVGEQGSAPTAVGEALDAGANRAVRLVEPALITADAHATGFALATALDHLKVDMVLCGGDSDPEGLGDVPASIAYHRKAMYLSGVLDLQPATIAGADATDQAAAIDGAVAVAVEVTMGGGPWIRRLQTPLNIVVRLAGGALVPATAGPSPRRRTAVQILTLADFKVDPELVRRHDDLRGVIEPAPRPLVTLQSAAAVGALLRRV